MPELPEVETIVRDLQKRIIGRKITGVTVPFPGIIANPVEEFCKDLVEAHFERLHRRGKIILADLSSGATLLIHLGMTGRLLLVPSSAPFEKHTHVLLNLGPDEHLRYVDVRRFGFLLTLGKNEVSNLLEGKKLGQEPFSIPEQEFCERLSTRKANIKAVLLNQTVVAGIGNIYADEILHRAGINPLLRAADLRTSQVKRLYRTMVEVLTEAIERKGSSVSDYVDASGRKGRYQDYHRVYRRTGQPCITCGTHITRKIIAGRSTHFCRVCQPFTKE